MAWLSLWVLSGRAHGVDDKYAFATRPEPFANENETRKRIWRASFLRKGVDREMVDIVQRLTCKNHRAVAEASRTRKRVKRIRNTAALHDASEKSRHDIDTIEAEWRGAGKK